VAGAPVTDWKNYDTIYTERYMRTPQENADGYEVGSCLKYAENLKGKLLIVHGMVDDNVHPNNVWQLVDLLQKADKPFDMMFYPTYDHGVGGNYSQLRWRYLREHLDVN
jgi:dipeptidyl-peptidase-4